MSFIGIKNPEERDRIVQDYIRTVQHIRERAEDEKAQGMRTKVQLSKAFSPIVDATKESTSKITQEMKKGRAATESGKGYWEKDFAKSAIDYYLDLKKNKDAYYGIQKTDEGYMMGDKNIIIDKDSNIMIGDHTYKATPGLWELIMLNNPLKNKIYTPSDMVEYVDIVFRTQVIDNPLTKNVGDKPRSTKKYREILRDLEEEEEVEEKEVEIPALEEGEKVASGIQYLPGNINGLLDRLKLLYGEREAGNISATSNQIVGILDELLRMSYLSREQYNMVCRSLEC